MMQVVWWFFPKYLKEDTTETSADFATLAVRTGREIKPRHQDKLLGGGCGMKHNLEFSTQSKDKLGRDFFFGGGRNRFEDGKNKNSDWARMKE